MPAATPLPSRCLPTSRPSWPRSPRRGQAPGPREAARLHPRRRRTDRGRGRRRRGADRADAAQQVHRRGPGLRRGGPVEPCPRRRGQLRHRCGPPGSPFATPWRVERGALFDLGPHVLDLMDAAMGRIEHVDALGRPAALDLDDHAPRGWCRRLSRGVHHHAPAGEEAFRCEVFTDAGPVVFDGAEADKDAGVGEAITRALARAVETGEPPLVDVHRGLHLQRLIAGLGG